MKRGRMIVEIENMDQARRVEETVKSGYSEVVIESLVQWLAVEEDLVYSYERLAKSLPDAAGREAAAKLGEQSRKEIAALSGLLSRFEEIDRDRQKRIQTVAGLMK
ncbi:MAG: hypothetical protein JRM80_04845 [Nitrososphaerota archaeon]|nr:hypothetical protein [Nitrososphaerota archaeon]